MFMKIPIYQIDAFASEVFRGNPAAVCPLDGWLDDGQLQAIAAENNLAETAYFVAEEDGYRLRWFTPEREVDLCGHATLASAYVIFQYLKPEIRTVTFNSQSGPLFVSRDGDLLRMDFPARAPVACPDSGTLSGALGKAPREILCSRDYLAIYDSEEEVRALRPNFEALKTLDRLGVIVTAPGNTADFVSRFFAPGAGIPEDPVTGSAHCTLAPYWAKRLGKTKLRAFQVSKRGGELSCELKENRVLIAGRSVRYMEGTIYV
jgi:predicted PhzF superfamily epimerase YddE/YHI9